MLKQRTFAEPAPTAGQAVLDALPEPVLLFDPAAGTLRPANSAAAAWISHGGSGNVARFSEVFPELDSATIPSADGGPIFARTPLAAVNGMRDVVLRILPLAGGKSSGENPTLVVIVRTVNSRTNEHEPLPRDAFDDAFHDWLTRLPNRRLFHRRLERALTRAAQSNYRFALLFVDLDGFKGVNDQFGHLEGDRLLLLAAHRMVEAVRPQDMVARRDGDEFTILLDDLSHLNDAVHIAQRIIQHLEAPLAIDATAPLNLRASIGIAMCHDGAITVDELIARADAAMYQAKKSGGNMFVLADNCPTADASASEHFRRLPR